MLNVRSPQKLSIKVFPLHSFNALTDISSGEIFLSSRCLSSNSISDVICDEIGHIISGDVTHSDRWQSTCKQLIGHVPKYSLDIDSIRRRIGISKYIGGNIGNITGISNLLTDYHLLMQYRRFSQRILGTEGHWEVLGDRKIRLYPTPKGVFPVVVLYLPAVRSFRGPIHRQLVMDMIVAEAKIVLGNARGKFNNIPSPDGGSMNLNGDALRQEGETEKKEITEKANQLAEPLAMYRY